MTITNLHRNTVPEHLQEETLDAIVARHRDPKIGECKSLFQEALNRYVAQRNQQREQGIDPAMLPDNERIVVMAIETLRKNGYTPDVIRAALQ